MTNLTQFTLSHYTEGEPHLICHHCFAYIDGDEDDWNDLAAVVALAQRHTCTPVEVTVPALTEYL